MPNTPALVRKGVFGFVQASPDNGLSTLIEDLCQPLGKVFELKDEEQFEAFTVTCSSGPGFIFEMMMYWQDWIEERGIDPTEARQMVVHTFLGAAELAAKNGDLPLEELQSKVTSKKGITAAGLESMRELEMERILRISFEKAALRNQELGKQD
jgi:pyrroline-5-carboxylate reductase